ncbi:tRNA dihydrouridine synthase DusB [Intestinimonas butyriciproducens]|uniref:tRNA dihydrouridine synthase DusB n=1 Tax=Intestinimonas butyriciproducens TaxID=1297617 RepID=UPI001C1088B4|nr:tRNA dihydrouridine synthase DusB [Intestinimonas butyriciproducens]
MEIGTVKVASRLALAPMAGVTDLGFRTVCRALGCGYTVTEMVSAKALCYQDRKSVPLLKLGEGEHPAAAQIFGSDPKCMEEAAAIAGEVSGAEIIDINMGCPVPKVANSGDGSGLMRTPELAVRVAEAVIRGAGDRPVTVKMRLGWDKGSINCVEFARAMEEAGVSAVAVHGRTRAQQYAGTANWDQIRAVKEALSIPVLANGDVFSPRDAVRILQYTGADAAMIGRGAFGNPWLFRQARAALEGEEIPPLPPLTERCDTAMEQFRINALHKGEKIACLEARRQYCWYLKGVPYAGYWKERICHVETMAELEEITQGIKRDLN